MLINGIDLSSLGIQLYNRVLNSNKVDTMEDWLDGDIQPTAIRQQDRFKTIQLEFLVLSADEEEAFMRISRLTQMLKKATLQFDDLSLLFDVSLQGASKPNRLKNGNFIVSYTLTSDYAKGSREIYTTNANMTNSFKLTVVYYQNNSTLLATESITIRASSFEETGNTLQDIGVDVNKYLPNYYNPGVATNLGNMELTYENLQSLNALIINYSPISYNLTFNYNMDDGTGFYNEILSRIVSFTYPGLQEINSISQLAEIKAYKPDGYKATVAYNGNLTIEELLKASPISVFFQKLENEESKNITIRYEKENDDGTYNLINTAVLNIRESDVIEGMTLKDLINLNTYRPEGGYFNEGFIVDFGEDDIITYDTLGVSYVVRYNRTINTLYVEYYVGTYPNWYRLTTNTITTKYLDVYEDEFDVIRDLNLNLNKYHTNEYYEGALYNADNYETYHAVMNAGILQIYYKEIDFPIVIRYYTGTLESLPIEETININALMFLNNPILNDIIPISLHRPEGYQYDEYYSYSGEVSLSALTQASPIIILYSEIVELRTKNIIVKYKQELNSAYSTINTSIITINEADVVGGIRLKDIINLDLYRPEYYESGIIDKYSSTALLDFESLGSAYDVLYLATEYKTPVRYYIDEVADMNWIGSSNITYRVIDFELGTTLFDLGLDLNAYKPGYAGDGILQYNGPINFSALLDLSSVDVVYIKEVEPEDPDGIDYPHRFLFLQHNDLGDYEHLHPEWTLNHAFINTGVSATDMSKLTVIMECKRVDNYVPLHEVNAGYAYLFGSSSNQGSYFMRFNNQTQYGTNLTGVNTYEAKAGRYTNMLTLTEDNAVGFGLNSGIYSSSQTGYSNVIFTYTNKLQTESAQMPYPLYLFANNNSGSYADGLAGIGIYSCRIYYEDTLLRDFIPVKFYDKIGQQTAPSNCLYDKVSQTFFEDGSKLNSFNIIDDDRYIDTNLEHLIGQCYVNYYKGNALFQTSTIWFRGNDFTTDNSWDPYEKFMVDEKQPSYYSSGVIKEMEDGFVVSFENLNNKTFNVFYEEQNNVITAKYVKEDQQGNREVLAEEVIPITEKDFYQVPSFGDIVRLNKYKPEGYETDFVYPGKRVSLARVLEHSPYEIVYKPMEEEPQTYNTVIRYIKKVFGIRTYEVVGTETLTFDQSNFRDGEYIDFYIDFNAKKPEKYYLDGETYEWYRMDERIDKPEDLKPLYTIWYAPETQYVDINYYTDDIDEANLIASTTWEFAIDSYEYPIQITDTLPNEYINKYKPVNCGGGMLQNPSAWYSFEDLTNLEEIAIMYESLVEPDDPINANYEKKVLYWGYDTSTSHDIMNNLSSVAGRIPYIDLGYRPKELGRLRVEFTGHVLGLGYTQKEIDITQFGAVQSWSAQSFDYLNFFGYHAPLHSKINTKHPFGNSITTPLGETFSLIGNHSYPAYSALSKGTFSARPRIPIVSGWTYTSLGPQSFDGNIYYTASGGMDSAGANVPITWNGIMGGYRRGVAKTYNDNYEEIDAFNFYGISQNVRIPMTVDLKNAGWPVCPDRTGVMGEEVSNATPAVFGNPFTFILDAWNNYAEIYTYNTSNSPYTINFENTDNDFYEGREQPKGSFTLFQTTNPTTGKVNIMPFSPILYPYVSNLGNLNVLEASTSTTSPYEDGPNYGKIEYETTVYKVNEDGRLVGEVITVVKSVYYAGFPMPQYPQVGGCYLWGFKLYDRDRLVRDLIPVAKGDKIYDYIMPENGLFDLITEIFFGNSNQGGTYSTFDFSGVSDNENKNLSASYVEKTIKPEDILPLKVMYDPLYYGKITANYYDWDNEFIANQYINVPTYNNPSNEAIENRLGFNDYKPDEFHLDGLLDADADIEIGKLTLKELYDMGLINIYYKLKTFTKTVVYYRDNYRIGSRDIFYSIEDIENANTLEDLGIDLDLYYDDKFKHGRLVFDESIIASNNIQAFIDAPSPIVVYDKFTADEADNILYVEYYRGGAYETDLITVDEENPNYLNCDLEGVVLNPNGAIKYYNHYHDALYEDEKFEYFIPYQVKVLNKYVGIHRGPARRYQTLAMIVERDTYTIIEERNGWGRLKEYPVGWIMLSATEPITGPGQNPDYDIPDEATATIPFKSGIHISKLTIDRLWCYIPEVESWVKAEDISFNQAGKLYNALGLIAIDLNDIDFSTATSLADVGIYPEARRLRFHDFTNYEYTGEYTYEAFSALHELDFVYPETVYNYTCIYYQDNKNEANELGRAGFSCSMSDWNPDWDIFIETSWRVDENEQPINPQLYRNTPLALTWDYFGFDKNLYRPAGYPDGVYLWNPRSWDTSGDILFSFEELIRTGSQYVLYAPFYPNTYKIKHPTENDVVIPLNAEHFRLDLKNSDYPPTDNIYDVDFSYEIAINPAGDLTYGTIGYKGGYGTQPNAEAVRKNYGEFGFSIDNGIHRLRITTTKGYNPNNTMNTWPDAYANFKSPIVPETLTKGLNFKANISNCRNTTNIVVGVQDVYTQKPFSYFYWDPDTNKFEPIKDNTNLYNKYAFKAFDDSLTDIADTPYPYDTRYAGIECVDMGASRVIGYNASLYKNLTLEDYWTPVPKGTWYRFNGEDLRIPENGWYNLMTGEFLAVPGSTVALRNKSIDEPYNYFNGWDFVSTEADYIVQTNSEVQTYQYPDLYAPENRQLVSGLIVPISKYTADADNKVVGEWYFSCDQWFESKTSSIYAGEFDKLKLTKLQQSICLINDANNSMNFYVYTNPTDAQGTTYSYGNASNILTTYYYYDADNGRYYFDGSFWVPESYTSLNITEVNKNYAIARDTNYYSVPIANEEYKLGIYLYGERITVPYVSTNNPDWAYTGRGWIQLANNTSEIL